MNFQNLGTETLLRRVQHGTPELITAEDVPGEDPENNAVQRLC
jgi:hypothetical protein